MVATQLGATMEVASVRVTGSDTSLAAYLVEVILVMTVSVVLCNSGIEFGH